VIDHIAIWANRHGISFAEFSAMVAIWSEDREYWAAQPVTRLYTEAIGPRSPLATAKAPFRV
jgi:hypothetical protein